MLGGSIENLAGQSQPVEGHDHQFIDEEDKGLHACDSTNDDKQVNFEEVLKTLGAFGKFQFLQCALCLSPLMVFAFMGLGFVFIGYTPPHVCNQVNETELLSSYNLQNDLSTIISYEQCHVTITSNKSGLPVQVAKVNCPNGRHFPEGKLMTLVSEWDLVCESKGIAELVFMLSTIGDIGGALIIPSVADRFGRKPVLSISVVLKFIIEVIISFSPNVYFYCFAFFVNNVVDSGVICVYLVLGMELLITRHREVFGIVACQYWVFCVVTVGCVAYFLRDSSWRYFQLTGALSGILSFPMVVFLDESVRWLAVNGKSKKAFDILKKASAQNKTDFANVKSAFEIYMKSLSRNGNEFRKDVIERKETFCNSVFKILRRKKKAENDAKKYTLINLLTRKDTLLIMLIMWYLWTTVNYTYFGIYMSSSDLAGNRYLNFCLIGLMEIPCNFVIMFLMRRIGRLPLLRIFLIFATLCLIGSLFLEIFQNDIYYSGTATLVLFLISAFAVSCFYNLLYIVTPEMFPTVLRSAGNGSCRAIPKIGYMLAPYTRLLYAEAKWAPALIFAALCVIAVSLTFLLPEMRDRILPTKLSDVGSKPKGRNWKQQSV